MSKHKHYEMIVAKAENMDLVRLFFNGMSKKWEIPENQDLMFCESVDYFLCAEHNAKATLHLLNGGKVQFMHNNNGAWLDSVKNSDDMQWSPNLDLMSEDYKFRIKPRKEKRWVVCSPVDGDVCDQLFTSKPDINAFGESCQVVEIEVEV